MPNSDVGSHLNIAYNSGIRSYKQIPLNADSEVVEVHYVASSTESLTESTRSFQSLGREESE